MRIDLPEWVERELAAPAWHNDDRVHCWRNYVPAIFRDSWSILSEETQRAIAFMAEAEAENEDWE